MKKSILIICLIVLIAVPCVWRLYPHSLEDILDVNKESVSTITVQITEAGKSDADGQPVIDTYCLDISSQEDSNYDAFMSILENTKFQSDFKNLLPGDTRNMSSKDDKNTHSASVVLKWGDADDMCAITFLDNSIVSVDISGKKESLVYHPTNRTTLDEIVTYVKENGEQK